MEVIPAIDIMQGKCVRLLRGSAEEKTVYGEPAAFAEKWKSQGAKLVHVVDLDAAMERGSNEDTIREIIGKGIAVQVAGGIRSIEAAEKWEALGAERMVLGTVAVKEPEKAREIVEMLGKKAWIAIDCRGKKVATRGWLSIGGKSAIEGAKNAESWGAGGLIVTDIERDGTLQGPNLELAREMMQSAALPVIVSGGISSVADCIAAKKSGASGVILGKALYEGKIALGEVMENVG